MVSRIIRCFSPTLNKFWITPSIHPSTPSRRARAKTRCKSPQVEGPSKTCRISGGVNFRTSVTVREQKERKQSEKQHVISYPIVAYFCIYIYLLNLSTYITSLLHTPCLWGAVFASSRLLLFVMAIGRWTMRYLQMQCKCANSRLSNPNSPQFQLINLICHTYCTQFVSRWLA